MFLQQKYFSDVYATNPQYFFTLTDPDPYDRDDKCPVVISLAQKSAERKQEHAIGFKIYKCKSNSVNKLDAKFIRYNVSVRLHESKL